MARLLRHVRTCIQNASAQSQLNFHGLQAKVEAVDAIIRFADLASQLADAVVRPM